MQSQHLLSIVVALLILATATFAQDAKQAELAPVRFGQSVYVVAVKSSGQPDLSTESKLKDEFQKQKAFNVATSLQSADLVFLMYIEYEYNQAYVSGVGGVGSEDIKSVAAFVVPPAVYTEHKANLDNLRDKALWQMAENNGMWRGGGLPKKIVKLFHGYVEKKRSARE